MLGEIIDGSFQNLSLVKVAALDYELENMYITRLRYFGHVDVRINRVCINILKCNGPR